MIHFKVRELLDMTYVVYANYRQQCFEYYCAYHANTKKLCRRSLITNEALYRWYCDNWNTRVESAFWHDHKDYYKASVKNAAVFRELFALYPLEIANFFPKPLIYKSKNDKNLNNGAIGNRL